MAARTASRRRILYRRPKLYPKQEAALFTPARYATVEASTKAGKTVGCLVWLHEQAALRGDPGRNFWWVAPIVTQAKIAFDRLRRFLPAGTFTYNLTDRTITLANGATIWFKGSDNPDSLYGEDVYAAVVDEASRVKEDAWFAIRSTLTATGGPIRLIGNVKGRRNWFYRLARRAEQGDDPDLHYARLTAYDAVEGGVFPASEVEDARKLLPKQAFDELYLAIPGDDGSNPFGRQAIVDCTKPLAAYTTGQIAFGVDLARGAQPGSDWTVVLGLNSAKETVKLHRFQMPWDAQVREIQRVTSGHRALVDSTGVGDAVLAYLQKGGSYEGFVFTQRSRQQLLESLALDISSREITFPEEVADELDNFEYQYTATGVRYAVPEGLHDDRAMALALAAKKSKRHLPRVVHT